MRCDHARFDTDATAPWGYDASRDASFCGHRDFQPGVLSPAHPLPGQLLRAPGHGTDGTMGPLRLDRVLTTCAAHALPVPVRAAV